MALTEVLLDFTNNTVKLDGKDVQCTSLDVHMEAGKPPQITIRTTTTMGNAVGQAEITQEGSTAAPATSADQPSPTAVEAQLAASDEPPAPGPIDQQQEQPPQQPPHRR